MPYNFNKKNNKLKDKVLSKIKSGDIVIKPKVYFILKTLFTVILALAALLAGSFFVSFTVFSIKESSKLFLLGFGDIGIWVFFATFPWFLMLITVFLLIVINKLLIYFEFAYKIPLIYLFLITIAVVMVISVFIYKTPIHETLYQEVMEDKLPELDLIYKDAKRPPNEKGVFRGFVASINDNSFTMYSDDYDKDKDDGYKTIFMPNNNVENILGIHIGEYVLAACSIDSSNRCVLYGLRELNKF